MMNYNITVAGVGYVGLVTGLALANSGNNVTCCDINEEKIRMLKQGIPPFFEPGLDNLLGSTIMSNLIHFTTDWKSAYSGADIIIIAVSSPSNANGSANLGYIETAMKQIAASISKDCLVVMKSTVPPGTTNALERPLREQVCRRNTSLWVEMASNPEFLAQGTAVYDTIHPSRIVIGCKSDRAESMLKDVYRPFKAPIICMDCASAELTKYASNCFLAVKLSYINEIANICELTGASIHQVTMAMSYDTRIGKEYMKAGIGFGGSCLPKDTRALTYFANEKGYSLQTVQAAVSVNEIQKMKLCYKAEKEIGGFQDKKIAVLGLTFKSGTDDLREAPSLKNISYISSKGGKITAYDPACIDNAKKIVSSNVVLTTDLNKALNMADACFIFTEWDDVRHLKPNDFLKMKKPIVFDGRNLFDSKTMLKNGVLYFSIGN